MQVRLYYNYKETIMSGRERREKKNPGKFLQNRQQTIKYEEVSKT